MPVNVSANRNWTAHGLHVDTAFENLAGLGAQGIASMRAGHASRAGVATHLDDELLDLCLCEVIATHQLFDPSVHILVLSLELPV